MDDFKQELLEALAGFDGKAISLLGEIEAQYGGDIRYVNELILLGSNDLNQVSSGATWLLKRHLEKGGKFLNSQSSDFLDCHTVLTDWQAKLHFCQSLRFLELADKNYDALANWLKAHLEHEKPFLRAWSLDGLVHLASLHGEFIEDANVALEKAKEDRAASVRARARNLSVKH